jgi:hypothetical protein
MAHSHDEQRLNELLREIAQEDRRAGPDAELERRVMARWDGPSSIDHRRSAIGGIAYWAICGVAAVLLIAIAIPRTRLTDLKVGTTAVTTTTPAASTMGSTVGSSTPSTVVPTFPPSRSYGEVSPERGEIGRAAVEKPASVSTTRRRTAPPTEPAQSETETIEFVPLVPMTAQELSGSFQIIRVQMPRASLGAFGSTLDVSGAGELVETDVLLGEDGMARAIRVSTSGMTYPWRSR